MVGRHGRAEGKFSLPFSAHIFTSLEENLPKRPKKNPRENKEELLDVLAILSPSLLFLLVSGQLRW